MFIAVMLQLVDFFLKASVEYVKTPEGRKEFDDIKEAAGLERTQPIGKVK